MKRKLQYCFWLFAALLWGGTLAAQVDTGVHFIDKPLDELLAQAKKENKLVFIDCYSTYCGPCKMMLKKEFPKKEMGDYLNASFVSAKMNLDLGEGPQLSRKWDVHSFPTFLFMDSYGNILHRMQGYMPAEQFIREAKEGLADNTFRTLEKKYQQGDRSREVVLAYMEGLKGMGRNQALHQVVTDFLAASQTELLSDTLAFSLFCQYVRSPYDSVFLKAYKNREAFIERYGAMAERKLENVWWEYPRSFTVFEGTEFKGFDREKLKKYAAFMKQYNVDADRILLDIDLSQACYIEDYEGMWKLAKQYYDMPDAQDGTLNYAFTLLAEYLKEKKDLKKLAKMLRFRLEALNRLGQSDLSPYPGEQFFPPEVYKSAYQQLLDKIEN